MDLAARSSDAQIITASSYDDRHPPSHIIEEDDSTFWSTTGTYPQEFVLQFGAASEISKISVVTSNVKSMVVERCEGSAPNSWEKVTEIQLDDTNGDLQNRSTSVSRVTSTFLKFRIDSGYSDYSTVHRVKCEGRRLD